MHYGEGSEWVVVSCSVANEREGGYVYNATIGTSVLFFFSPRLLAYIFPDPNLSLQTTLLRLLLLLPLPSSPVLLSFPFSLQPFVLRYSSNANWFRHLPKFMTNRLLTLTYFFERANGTRGSLSVTMIEIIAAATASAKLLRKSAQKGSARNLRRLAMRMGEGEGLEKKPARMKGGKC